MKLAESCETSPSYIGEIETGRKFPSTEMIEKIAETLRIEPYHLFIDRKDGKDIDSNLKSAYPLLPNSMKTEMKDEITCAITDILSRY